MAEEEVESPSGTAGLHTDLTKVATSVAVEAFKVTLENSETH